MYAESQVWESDDDHAHVLVTYRVRVCTRCGHAACPCCNGTWCDMCLGTSGDGIVVNEACAEATECVYEEFEAVTEVRREVKTEAEYEEWFNEEDNVDPVKIEACARAAHEVNRAYCIALGDLSQPSWEAAPGWQQSSAINGVKGALAGNTPEQSHESWLAEKKATGWKYGPVKDPEKKEHPCFVPYADLPPAQRHKDALFTSTVCAVGKALGLL